MTCEQKQILNLPWAGNVAQMAEGLVRTGLGRIELFHCG